MVKSYIFNKIFQIVCISIIGKYTQKITKYEKFFIVYFILYNN